MILKKRIFNNKHEIWDSVRRKWLKETPEEIVRQTFIYYLVHVKNMPENLISVEKQINYMGSVKRYDIVVYTKTKQVFMAVECKANHISLTQEVVNQLAVYNLELKASYLAVTNGVHNCFIKMDYEHGTYQIMETCPNYPVIDIKC